MENFILEYISEYIVLIIIAFFGFGFKDTIQNFFIGLQFLWGSDFDIDDIVYIKGVKKARIVRQTIWKTTFYVYPHDRKFVVPNNVLWSLGIEKQLKPLVEDENENN